MSLAVQALNPVPAAAAFVGRAPPTRWRADALAALAAARDASPGLVAAASLLLLMALPTGLAHLLDAKTLGGVGVWVKPLKFQASLALHLTTVAWAMSLLPPAVRARRMVSAAVAAMVVAALTEIVYIAVRAARGEASHFNVATPFDAAMYGLMGVGAVTLVAASGVVGALLLRHGDRHDPMALAAGLGLVAGSLLGGLSGAYMSAQTGHGVGGVAGGAVLPIVGWSRTGGDLRVAHFVGLHLMQGLPLLTWLAARRAPATRRRLVAAALVAGAALTAAVLAQAVAGRPLLPVG